MFIHSCMVHGCSHTKALIAATETICLQNTGTFLSQPFTEKSLLTHSLYDQIEGYGYICTHLDAQQISF